MAYCAIKTKYLGPTDYRGARIKASAMDSYNRDERKKSVTIPYDYGFTHERLHRDAAELLLPQVVHNPKIVRLVAGGCEDGYVFVPELIREVGILDSRVG